MGPMNLESAACGSARRSNARMLVLLVGVATATGACGGQASGPPSPPLPAAVVLRIDAVEVSSTRQGSPLGWDGDEVGTEPGAVCRVVVAGARSGMMKV